MGLVCEALRSVSAALAKIDGNGQCGGTRRNMDGCTTSEIETTENERPAVGVPRPTSDGIVNYGRPDESKKDGGTQACAFGDCA